jgi:hypothetical protein
MPETYQSPLTERKSATESADNGRTSDDRPMSPEEEKERRERLRRRMRAAMALAGIPNVPELAKRCADLGYEDGFSKGTLETMHSGKRTIRTSETIVLAEVCGLPAAFFSVDFATLAEPDLRQEVQTLKEQVSDLMQAALRAERAIGEWERTGRLRAEPKDEEQ